jgi:hypothetical protein
MPVLKELGGSPIPVRETCLASQFNSARTLSTARPVAPTVKPIVPGGQSLVMLTAHQRSCSNDSAVAYTIYPNNSCVSLLYPSRSAAIPFAPRPAAYQYMCNDTGAFYSSCSATIMGTCMNCGPWLPANSDDCMPHIDASTLMTHRCVGTGDPWPQFQGQEYAVYQSVPLCQAEKNSHWLNSTVQLLHGKTIGSCFSVGRYYRGFGCNTTHCSAIACVDENCTRCFEAMEPFTPVGDLIYSTNTCPQAGKIGNPWWGTDVLTAAHYHIINVTGTYTLVPPPLELTVQITGPVAPPAAAPTGAPFVSIAPSAAPGSASPAAAANPTSQVTPVSSPLANIGAPIDTRSINATPSLDGNTDRGSGLICMTSGQLAGLIIGFLLVILLLIIAFVWIHFAGRRCCCCFIPICFCCRRKKEKKKEMKDQENPIVSPVGNNRRIESTSESNVSEESQSTGESSSEEQDDDESTSS